MKEKNIFIIIFFFSFILFLIINLPTPIPVQGDGVFYYGWATSVIFDQDLDLFNQLQHSSQYDFYSKSFIEKNIKTITGFTPNPYAFGTALLWAPFILIINAGYHIGELFGLDVMINGYNAIYIFCLNLASWLFGMIAFVVIYKILRFYFSYNISLITTIAMWLATPWVYYQFFEPSMSHAASIMMISLFLWQSIEIIYSKDRLSKLKYFFFLCIVFLMVAVRWQNILFVIAILPILFDLKNKKASLYLFSGIIIVSGIWFVVQIFAWKVIYGVYILIPQGNEFLGQSFYFIQTLFSSNRGLLLWSPILIMSLSGLFYLFKKNRKIAWVCLLAFLAQWILNSLLSDPGGGDAFGGRRFIGTLPFLALLLASFLERFQKNKVIIFMIIFLIFWNMILIQNYRLNNIPHNGIFNIYDINYLKIF